MKTNQQSPLRKARDNWYRANLSKMTDPQRKEMRELLGQAFTAGANWAAREYGGEPDNGEICAHCGKTYGDHFGYACQGSNTRFSTTGGKI